MKFLANWKDYVYWYYDGYKLFHSVKPLTGYELVKRPLEGV